MLAGSTVSCQMRQAGHAMAADVKLARVAKHLDSKLSAQSRKYAYSLFVGLPLIFLPRSDFSLKQSFAWLWPVAPFSWLVLPFVETLIRRVME